MSAVRRCITQNAIRSRIARSRYSTGQHGKEGNEVLHFAGSSTEHGHHSAGPKNESLGPQFFICLALIPASFALYAASRPNRDGAPTSLTKFFESYSYYKEKWAARNTLHTAMVEQAAFDRNLFQSSQRSSHVNLRFPEIFNTGSPHNVPAGHTANLDHLVEHYKAENAQQETRKVEALNKTSDR